MAKAKNKGMILLGAMALMGFAFSGDKRRLMQMPRREGAFQFTRLLAGFAHPVTIAPQEIVFFFGEHRQGHPAHTTMVQLKHGARTLSIWITEPISSLLRTLASKDFVQVHFPVGQSSHGQRPRMDKDPSMEIRGLWIAREAIDAIGPSTVLHTKRRRLGKIYTRDGHEFELYESLSTLKNMLPDVHELSTTYKPRH